MFQSLEAKHPKFYQVFRFFVVIAASIFYAWNLRCFAKTAGLFPGGFSGLSLLLQEIGLAFFGISIPYTLLNVLLNLFPTYIAYKYIGKRFTLYSIVVIVLSSIFVDILPPYMFTDDILLLSVFGGILNGFATSLCLNVGTTTGGTDFISIFFAHEIYFNRKCDYACHCGCAVWLVECAVFDYFPVLQHTGYSGTV